MRKTISIGPEGNLIGRPLTKQELKKREAYKKRIKKRLETINWNPTSTITRPQRLEFENCEYHALDNIAIQDFFLSGEKGEKCIFSIYSKGIEFSEEHKNRFIYEVFCIGFGQPKNQIYKKCATVSMDIQIPKFESDFNGTIKLVIGSCFSVTVKINE
jgi:hypothetical protein